ncbi:hypothetical protein EDD85DRAFT_839955 [Armillaria nabsnona]|nr:hypothetical protein EDD85DRAFT_839955 [Armillaria nabsnona]
MALTVIPCLVLVRNCLLVFPRGFRGSCIFRSYSPCRVRRRYNLLLPLTLFENSPAVLTGTSFDLFRYCMEVIETIWVRPWELR